MKKATLLSLFLCLSLFFIALTGCAQQSAETFAPTEDPNSLITEYAAVVVGADDLAALDIYPNLAKLDLRGSTCYADILAYMAAHPQVEVIYDVVLGAECYGSEAESLTLAAGSFTADELTQKLTYLPRAASVSLPETHLSPEALAALSETFPNIRFDYTVSFLDQIIPGSTDSLDLSGLSPDQLSEAQELLKKLPSLANVELMDAEGKSQLSMTDVKLLMDAAPNASFHYTFHLFGKSVSTADTRVEYAGTQIGDTGVEQVRQALDILPDCTYFLMDQCGISNEVMDQLNRDYPNTQVVWRIHYGNGYSSLTDSTVVRCVGDLDNANSKNLKYMTEVVYLDAGHCYVLSDLSFVSYMPNLKVAIFSDCSVSDLTPFTSCKKLEYVEFVNCNFLKELTPMAECESLKGINLSWNFNIKDLDPLYGLENLERLYCGRHGFTQEEIDEAKAALPDCWVTASAESVAWISFNYSVGWRLDDEHTFAEWYKEIKEVFGYTREIY